MNEVVLNDSRPYSKARLLFFFCAVVVLVVGLFRFAGEYLFEQITQDLGSTVSAPTTVTQKNVYLAPDFELTDTNRHVVRLSDKVGKRVVLLFWTTWNRDSRDELKALDDLVAAGDTSDMHVFAINSQEDASVAKSFLSRGGYSLPALLDTDGAVTDMYAARTLPVLFLIDSKSRVVEKIEGLQSKQEIVDNLRRLEPRDVLK